MPDPLNPPAVTFNAEYTPFGETFNVAGTEGFRFTGERTDAATGFTHLRARQYDPATGRFTGADPMDVKVNAFLVRDAAGDYAWPDEVIEERVTTARSS